MQAEETRKERVGVFSRQMCMGRVSVCECFNWVFNQGVMLSVPIRCSRQGSPAGCFSTTTLSKRQIMIPRSDSENQHYSSLAFSLPLALSLHQPIFISLLHIFAPSQIDGVWKWKTMRGRWEQVWACLVTRQWEKQENLIWAANQYDSVLCPLALCMSQAIFKDHLTDTHTHTHALYCVSHTAGKAQTIIALFVFECTP